MDAYILASACKLYHTTPTKLVPLSGGHYNAVYRFPMDPCSLVSETSEAENTPWVSRCGVLRIGIEDCPVEQTLGMLEWVQFLSQQGGPVTAPIASIRGHLLERLEQDDKRYTVTAFDEAEGILAERIHPREWNDGLFRKIGRTVGKLHAISKHYQPSDPSHVRPQWFNGYEVREAVERLRSSDDPAREKLDSLIKELTQLPTAPVDYGLIHGDLHFANFLIQRDGRVAIIDFDDCMYGWYVLDVAMALFDVLVLYPAENEKQSRDFARNFITNYLRDYREENELSSFWEKQIPRFLKLKEICIYVDLIGHPDIGQPDSWVGSFMRGRAERIAKDVPYVELEFGNLKGSLHGEH